MTGSFQSLFVTIDDSSDLTAVAVDLRTFATQIMIAHCPSENHAIGLAESLRAKGEEDEQPVVTGAEDEQPVVTGAVAEVALARLPDAVAVVVMSLCRSN